MLELGLVLGYSGRDFSIDIELIREAEELGYRSVWTSEAYGSDAVSPAAWILAQTKRLIVGTALMQMPARSPACAAMTALTLQALSGGRFVLGIGPSGPQVVEGWHGVAYGKPLERLRDYVAIVRKIVAREEPVSHDGSHYRLPYDGPDATGLGKPLKSILHAQHPLPIFTGSVSPGGLRLAGEITDGLFPLFMMPERAHVYREPLVEGFRNGGYGDNREDFVIAPFVDVRIADDHAAALLAVKQSLALYVGGMGAKGRNFYTSYAERLGFADAAAKIQELFLSGDKRGAVMAVPDEFADGVALVGPKGHIRERLQAWKSAAAEGSVTTLLLAGAGRDEIRFVAEEVL
jgi:F420-dependent oxidoreductase-like protein